MKGLCTLSIVSHGDYKKIQHLLNSLQRSENKLNRFQIILTDNLGSEIPDFDSSPWYSLHIVRNEHPISFAKNHNKAFELAQGEYFAILNPDLIFASPVFEVLANDLEVHRIDLVAPKIIDEKGVQQDSFRELPTPLKLIKRRLLGEGIKIFKTDVNNFIEPDWIAGMFWLMKSDTYRRLGGLDEKFRLYFEDVDFCVRARLQGMKIAVDTNLQIRHDARRSSRKRVYYLLLHTLSAIQFFTSTVYCQTRKKK